MARYRVIIDCTNMRASLSELEQGNPVREFVLPTASAARQLRNAALFCAGLTMNRGMTSFKVGQSETFDITTLRREA